MRYLILSSVALLCYVVIFAQDTTRWKPRKSLKQIDSLHWYGWQEMSIDHLPTVSIDGNHVGEGYTLQIGGNLNASRDPFHGTALMALQAGKFKLRGYEGHLFNGHLQGVRINQLHNGLIPWSHWSGLNEMFRNRQGQKGLSPNDFGWGNWGGTTYFDLRSAYNQAKTSLIWGVGNRFYRNRWSLNHHSGINKHGWAYSLSVSGRTGEHVPAKGVHTKMLGYFVSLEKKDIKNSYAITLFNTESEQGKQAPSVKEAFVLTQSMLYNPAWGWDEGKIRNAQVIRQSHPTLLLNYERKPHSNLRWMTTVLLSHGERSVSGIDWYNTLDPRPDYYRYLPSFNTQENIRTQKELMWRNDPSKRQINWTRFREINAFSRSTIENVWNAPNGTITGRRSRYMVDEKVHEIQRAILGTWIQSKWKSWDIYGGGQIQFQHNNYFRRVKDLLGSEFHIDINRFAERLHRGEMMMAQNDVTRPNRIVREGEKWGYDYSLPMAQQFLWLQGIYQSRSLDYFIAGELTNTSFKRIGHVQNGIFPEHSLGSDKGYSFLTFQSKAGLTYKITGRQNIRLQIGKSTHAPFADQVYVSPRTRNITQENIEPWSIEGGELGYSYVGENWKLKLNGYYNLISNRMKVSTFYHEYYDHFVNYAIRNINTIHRGIEFAWEWQVVPEITSTLAAAYGDHYYRTNHLADVTVDNQGISPSKTEEIFAKNFSVSGSPQEAYTWIVNYRNENYFQAGFSIAAFRRHYLGINPIRRTFDALEFIDRSSQAFTEIFNQKVWPTQIHADVQFSKSWRIKTPWSIKPYTNITVQGSIQNLLDNRNILQSGYEQMRFDLSERNPHAFPHRFLFVPGRTFQLQFQIHI